jgi:hypothetical protein
MTSLSLQQEIVQYYKQGKSPFLAIQFLTQFDFGHRISKPSIFDHTTLKTVDNWPSGCFVKWFKLFYLQFSP